MPLVVGEVVQVSYRGTCLAQRILFITNWRVTSTASASPLLQDLDNVALHFLTPGLSDLSSDYLGCLGTNYAGDEVRAQVVRPARSIFVPRVWTGVGAGQDAATTANIAGTFTRVSQAAGRKGISTSHIGPLPAGSLSAGLLDAATVGALGACAATFAAPTTVTAGTIALEPVILHPIGSVTPATTIVAFRVGDTARTMRRRTVRVGE